ncbi:MAG: NAD(+)/NADH kinase [Planctomycetota bacterium]
MADRPRILLLCNHGKPPVQAALESFRPWLGERAEIVAEHGTREMTAQAASALPDADLALILGGDGTVLSQARALVDRGIPMLGINFGKLGFLAEFTIESVKKHWDAIVGGRCRVSERIMLQVSVYPAGAPLWGGANGEGDKPVQMPEPVFHGLALNDAVINAGEPFRMVEIELIIEPAWSRQSATTFLGDGVVVSTPSGSTAYNLSAGGPIVSPGIDGLCVAPLNPQSLAFRPIVFSGTCDTWMALHRANPGTTLVLDGQVSSRLEVGQQVRVTKHSKTFRLIHNPELSYWSMLANKMHWAVRPRRD